jgi:hypothetical protein
MEFTGSAPLTVLAVDVDYPTPGSGQYRIFRKVITPTGNSGKTTTRVTSSGWVEFRDSSQAPTHGTLVLEKTDLDPLSNTSLPDIIAVPHSELSGILRAGEESEARMRNAPVDDNTFEGGLSSDSDKSDTLEQAGSEPLPESSPEEDNEEDENFESLRKRKAPEESSSETSSEASEDVGEISVTRIRRSTGGETSENDLTGDDTREGSDETRETSLAPSSEASSGSGLHTRSRRTKKSKRTH